MVILKRVFIISLSEIINYEATPRSCDTKLKNEYEAIVVSKTPRRKIEK